MSDMPDVIYAKKHQCDHGYYIARDNLTEVREFLLLNEGYDKYHSDKAMNQAKRELLDEVESRCDQNMTPESEAFLSEVINTIKKERGDL